jgi:hypothetical protein
MPPYPIPFCKAGRTRATQRPNKDPSLAFARSQSRLRRGSTTSTSEATAELGLELAGGTALALLAGITSSVSLTVTTTATVTATAASTAVAVVAAHHAARGRVSALLLDVRVGHNLSGEVEPFAEVVETLGGKGVVVVLPREAGLDEAAGGERLACVVLTSGRSNAGGAGILTSLDDVKVLGVDVTVLGKVEVLLRNEYALCGDRVSAYPCMQHKATKLCMWCHSHGSFGRNTNRGRGTCEHVVSKRSIAMLLREEKHGRAHRGNWTTSCEIPESIALRLCFVEED